MKKFLKAALSNVIGCKRCNTKGSVLWGHNLGEPIYVDCPDCDGEGVIVKGYKSHKKRGG